MQYPSAEIPPAHYELTEALHSFIAETQRITTTQYDMFGAAHFLSDERKAAFTKEVTSIKDGNELLVGSVLNELAEAGSDIFVATPENQTPRELMGVTYIPGLAYIMRLGREPHVHPSVPQDPSRFAQIPFVATSAIFTLFKRPQPLMIPQRNGRAPFPMGR